MSNSRLLTTPRELTKEELEQIDEAQSKWYPKLIQSYDTTLYEMMADPVLKAIAHLCIISFSLGVGLLVLKLVLGPKTKFFNVFKKREGLLYILGIVVFSVIVCITTVMSQTKLNNNLVLVMKYTKPGATKYDYESSPVIRDQMMRKAMRGRSSGAGSAVLGGVVGGAIGSGSRSRR